MTNRNIEAFNDPKVGDFWLERIFTPYFLIVDVQDDSYTILGCWDSDRNGCTVRNARVQDPHSSTYHFDSSKYSVVSKDWIQKTVKYSSGTGFVADVSNESFEAIVRKWTELNPNYHPVPVGRPKHLDVFFLGS